MGHSGVGSSFVFGGFAMKSVLFCSVDGFAALKHGVIFAPPYSQLPTCRSLLASMSGHCC